MKRITVLLVSMLFVWILKAQVNENFDSYTAGQPFAQQAGSPWTTWSNSPGSSEDPLVTNAIAYSDSNSIVIANNNDLVLNVNDITTGKTKLTFMAYIESGKIGYFNALQDFAGSNSVWGFQVYFRSGGQGSIDANGAESAIFSFPYDTWFPIELYVDLDQDLATFVVNNSEVYSWKWSEGSFGGNNNLKLDAFDFFGWTGDNQNETSGLYMDDVVFDPSLSALDAPLNLTATLNNKDVDLTWDAPANAPVSYAVFRNGIEIANNITGTSYTDPNVYPGDYVYVVRGYYNGEGYSLASNEASVNIPGGVDRDYVLVEEFTEVNCYYCPGAAMGIDDMVANGDKIAPVAYHTQWQGSDEFYLPVVDTRVGYYNVGGTPTVEMDGSFHEWVGGDHTQSLYGAYQPSYEERIVHKALYTITPEVVAIGNNEYTVNVKINQFSDYFPGNKSLFVAITETDIPRSWQGLTKVNFALRKMIPGSTGETVSFASAEDSVEFSYNFSADSTWNLANCDVVIFLQDNGTKEVLQTTKLALPVTNAVSYKNKNDFRIYPNPAENEFVITNASGCTYKISNLIGVKVKEGKVKSNLQLVNIKDLKPGVYFVELSKGNESHTIKLLKK